MSKEEVLEVINTLPDDVSFDEVMYSLYMASNMKQGLTDISTGKTYSHEQVKAMFQ